MIQNASKCWNAWWIQHFLNSKHFADLCYFMFSASYSEWSHGCITPFQATSRRLLWLPSTFTSIAHHFAVASLGCRRDNDDNNNENSNMIKYLHDHDGHCCQGHWQCHWQCHWHGHPPLLLFLLICLVIIIIFFIFIFIILVVVVGGSGTIIVIIKVMAIFIKRTLIATLITLNTYRHLRTWANWL